MSFEILCRGLKELHEHLEPIGCRIIIGGGLGLYVRQINLTHESVTRTLIPSASWPVPRSTGDIDWFIETSVLVNASQMKAIKDCLDKLGYIPTVPFLHFKKTFVANHEVEINLLTEPLANELLPRVKINEFRVRPKADNVLLHAYLTDSALGLSKMALELQVNQLPGLSGANFTVWIPHPVTMLLMKLHAFSDRIDDPNKDSGSHHALDIYRTIAMMTEPEYDAAKEFFDAHSTNSVVISAKDIIGKYFDQNDKLGFVRIREHKLFTSALDLEKFRIALIGLR